MRRAVLMWPLLAGMPAMTSGDLERGRPLNAPPGAPLVPGVQPGSPGVVFARRVIIGGPNDGLFVFSGTPAFGNLAVSITAGAGTILGNAYLAGETTYATAGSPRTARQRTAGIDLLYTAPTAAGPWASTGTEIAMATGNIILTTSGVAGMQALQTATAGQFNTGVGGSGSVGIQSGTGRHVIYGPSGDTTGATDSPVIAGFLTAGYEVQLLPGTFYLNAPLVIPDQGVLTSVDPSWGIPTGNYGAGGLPLQGPIIRAGSAFAGAALISMGSAGTTQHGGQRITGITLSGTGAPANTNGIQSIGYVGGVKLEDVTVWGNAILAIGLLATNDGTAGHNPDFWQVTRCKFSNCTTWGVQTLGLSDSWFTDCESTGNATGGTGGGWSITAGADSRWTACRADSNGNTPGFALTPTGTGTLSFTNCEANLNGTGWQFNGGSAAPYLLSNCIANGNTTAAYSYAAGAAVRSDGGSFTVWVPLTPLNGWANSGVGPNAQYTWRGSSVEIIADLTAGTLTGGTNLFNLPASAALAHAQTLPILDETTRTAQAQLNVGVAGACTFFQGIGAVAAADRCFIHGQVSTDA